ncbi:chemotaxis protein methyltransferase 3 [Marinibactrum halimedae]|uniref:Chemotaxis protein methyltransferase n=1 Tax=Marinibactrum halimedae TaxID=1444977 RepID=A0AA37T3Q2_9GAMM|nr:protein-glutamate O-methyltransferase CheR [Marinibactrum halimedae]GLS24403.1 chemotaxis protein methyltransferase 3 [Marinibactrum halimedae]
MNLERIEQHSLSDQEFAYLCQLVHDSTGIVLTEQKRQMVYRRLMRRTRELKITSFSEYCKLLKKADNEEMVNFINAITTNLTSFFREEHHFDFLRESYFPKILSDNSKRLRCWSAGCSTGEEAYSLAITINDVFSSVMSSWDIKVLATDLDTQVLETACNGIYAENRIEEIPESIKLKWFKPGSGENEGLVKVKKDLRRLISFKQLNLLSLWPMRGQFDVIFCRNVMIYFDRDTQKKLIDRFCDLLPSGGFLMTGHSESCAKAVPYLHQCGRTIFQKKHDRVL